MLNFTDIHYLVALLTKTANAKDISVELGSRVKDEFVGIERDIDITLTRKNRDGTFAEYKGFEVKAHHRPLNIEQVEQLCAKFSRLPNITHKAIVSASGYTKSSIEAASYYKVELFEIKPWKDPMQGFNHIQFSPECFVFFENLRSWKSFPKIYAILNQADFIKVKESKFKKDFKVFDFKGEQYDDIVNLSDLKEKVANQVLSNSEKLLELNHATNQAIKTQVIFNAKLPHIQIENRLIPIQAFNISGEVKKTTIQHKPELKLLSKLGENEPIAGCAIFQLATGNLKGISVNKTNNYITSLNIPLKDRLKKSIRKQCIT